MDEDTIPVIIVSAVLVVIIICSWGYVFNVTKDYTPPVCVEYKKIISVEPIAVSGLFSGHVEFIEKYDDGSYYSTQFPEKIGYKECNY